MKQHIDLTPLLQKNDIKVGVISDTHNQLNQEIIHALQDCDVILHAGDIGEAQVLDDLKQFTPHVFPVRGNNDVEHKWPEEDLGVLEQIPEQIEFTFNNEAIGLIHGHQYDPVHKRHYKLREHFPNANIIIYGHSHRYVFDQEQAPWVINPGAGGYTRTFGGASCVVMHYENEQWRVEETRLEK